MAVILGIESSCDDTAAAVCINGVIASNVVAGQAVHLEYGGVVPELASRAHQQNIVPVVDQALERASLSIHDVDAIAFTKGPGLLGPLLVGTSFAKASALALNIPLIDVNHIEAHIFAHYIDAPKPNFPYICLTVSGGHTQLVLVRDFFDMQIIGETLDDAAGEAFDKAGKILGLDYPAGPLIDKHAKLGDATRFSFPEPEVGELEFSFSGLKTSILYFIQREQQKNPKFIEQNRDDLCASIQGRIVEILMKKLLLAAQKFDVKNLAIAGGVSANSGLRNALFLMEGKGYQTFIPKFEYCTDNAAMIAICGHYKMEKSLFADQDVSPDPRMGR